jgi:hypothetical protein
VVNGWAASAAISTAISLSTLTLGCGTEAAPQASEPTLLESPLGELPAKLSQVGLYRRLPELELAPRALAYEPGYPLWSDGGAKQRALVLPEGETIDATDATAYVFPTGTLLFKTFSFRTPSSSQQVVPVETRVLRRTEDGWEFSAYGWDEQGQDAELLDLKRGETRRVLSEDGEVVEHGIPSRLECRQCHESSTSEVLGVNELQLAKSGSLAELTEHLRPTPKKPYAELPPHGPLTTRVLGYLVGNCVHCHNGTNGAASAFDLRPDVALQNLIDRPTESSATADGIRIRPGEPDESVLFLGVKGVPDAEVKDMPPLGVALRDASAVELLNSWITALAETQDP